MKWDPAVGPVEEILAAAAARRPASAPVVGGRMRVRHALWLCCCVTTDATEDAPTWLIYDTDEGGLGWLRVPERSGVTDLVDARDIAGGHGEPDRVLLWLRGETDEPYWDVDRGADRIIAGELLALIRSTI